MLVKLYTFLSRWTKSCVLPPRRESTICRTMTPLSKEGCTSTMHRKDRIHYVCVVTRHKHSSSPVFICCGLVWN
ncbi:hypothetical protein DPMN_072641 [Dreissena polymorpha]|uniref:Uncharacterized protein n=1 Tax=Dreissena polymorpha TaxID=45954 RepID=A0A9D4BXN2_DREPO|nr:hypothetical protein DPMN_072641 [Dreissena polymorpha]